MKTSGGDEMENFKKRKHNFFMYFFLSCSRVDELNMSLSFLHCIICFFNVVEKWAW